jgi:hypothetical protein
VFGWGKKKQDKEPERAPEPAPVPQPSGGNRVTKVLVLYYSSYGHIETMVRAVAEGAAQVPGAEVTVKRVRELVPDEVAAKSGMKTNQDAPFADPGELGDSSRPGDVNKTFIASGCPPLRVPLFMTATRGASACTRTGAFDTG